MFHERTNKILLLLKRKTMTTGLFSQTQKIIRSIIRHRIPLHISPHILYRIKFRSIGRQEFRMKCFGASDIRLNFICPMWHVYWHQDEAGNRVGSGLFPERHKEQQSPKLGLCPIKKIRCLATRSPAPADQRHQ